MPAFASRTKNAFLDFFVFQQISYTAIFTHLTIYLPAFSPSPLVATKSTATKGKPFSSFVSRTSYGITPLRSDYFTSTLRDNQLSSFMQLSLISSKNIIGDTSTILLILIQFYLQRTGILISSQCLMEYDYCVCIYLYIYIYICIQRCLGVSHFFI